ncbi:MFS general substrate transporter [Aspergillus vadensis CBS 113365]|uniref:MFS general substrate transporter n=1 Tax=Aspergillus vadensis (strain CBS 113365 / IMI 142717 / IBT 24658) TaxID=1448311 RepID=A0A319AU06_ASPVC|nr:MFS general substrate transporter [Aspergillus vadensis CBS 113365]PYH63816.1 MFS general substrate transporter [Aspergillus vadensis CBS 113365]
MTQLVAAFVLTASALSMSPMFPAFTESFHPNNTQLLLITGVCILSFAYANLIVVPCSNIFGRRLTFLVFLAISIASYVWEALASSYTSFIVARVVNGAGAAACETIPMQTVADLFFLYERGQWTVAYFTAASFGSFLGPVISGNITQRFGWRSFFWLSMAMTCFNFITILLCSPETKYHRDPASKPPRHTPHTSHTLESYDSPTDISPTVDSKEIYSTQAPPPPKPGTGSPCSAQFKLWQAPDPQWKAFLLRDIFTPFRICLYPIIFWAAATVSGVANFVLFWNLTESSVLGAPPYNFNASQVGYSNFAFLIGCIVGLITAGPLSDWVAVKATQRNKGVYEAEMRLLALIPPSVILLISVLVGSFAILDLWPWPVLLIFAYGLSGLVVSAMSSNAVAYAMDSYKPVSGEIMAVVTIIRNTCGFTMSYWLALTFGPLALGVPMYLFGKRLRVWTKDSSVHLYGG